MLRRSANGSGADDLIGSYLQPGKNLLAAGFVIYGPRTALVLTLGDGTHVLRLILRRTNFAQCVQCKAPRQVANMQLMPQTTVTGIMPSKLMSMIVLMGRMGCVPLIFNMRWIGSPVAEIYRIFTRGGIYLYPADAREGYRDGRFRLIFEANPIAMVVEQAGGAASTGLARIWS